MTRYTRGLIADVLVYMRTVGDEGTTVAQVADHFGISSKQATSLLVRLEHGGEVRNWSPEHNPRPKIWAVKSRTGASA